MQNDGIDVEAGESHRSVLRKSPKQGKLPCGARYCHRCTEECGVIVNAYIVHDLATESADDVAMCDEQSQISFEETISFRKEVVGKDARSDWSQGS